tara:strand:- start:4693 stop:4974 length:282 start_codon:yes stop_codon:yes gene_type:complete
MAPYGPKLVDEKTSMDPVYERIRQRLLNTVSPMIPSGDTRANAAKAILQGLSTLVPQSPETVINPTSPSIYKPIDARIRATMNLRNRQPEGEV